MRFDEDFFLVAFSKFDRENRAQLKLNEYASCILNVWNEVNTLHVNDVQEGKCRSFVCFINTIQIRIP